MRTYAIIQVVVLRHIMDSPVEGSDRMSTKFCFYFKNLSRHVALGLCGHSVYEGDSVFRTGTKPVKISTVNCYVMMSRLVALC